MIIQNALKINDKIICSKSVHDFQQYEGIFVDGGTEYFRSNWNNETYPDITIKDLRISTESSLEDIINNLIWGSYGIDENGVSNWLTWRDSEPVTEDLTELGKWLQEKPKKTYLILAECSLDHLKRIYKMYEAGEIYLQPLYNYVINTLINRKTNEEIRFAKDIKNESV